MPTDRVAVTGGNGKIGRRILSHLAEEGYHTVNVSRGKQREDASDQYMSVDLLDAGAVYGALNRTDVDAVIHMGTIPGPTNHPGHETYESNVMSSYNILEAATGLGIESVCLASSVNAIGSAHQPAPADIRYLPVDESHPRTPIDPYGIGKHAVEITADGFGRRDGAPTTVSTFRYPWVGTEDELREMFVENDRDLSALEDAWHHTTRDVLFSYLHIDDAATAARRAVEADFSGHETFWIVAGDTTAEAPSAELAEHYYPTAEIRSKIAETDGLIDISKAANLLGWTPDYSWRELRNVK